MPSPQEIQQRCIREACTNEKHFHRKNLYMARSLHLTTLRSDAKEVRRIFSVGAAASEVRAVVLGGLHLLRTSCPNKLG